MNTTTNEKGNTSSTDYAKIPSGKVADDSKYSQIKKLNSNEGSSVKLQLAG